MTSVADEAGAERLASAWFKLYTSSKLRAPVGELYARSLQESGGLPNWRIKEGGRPFFTDIAAASTLYCIATLAIMTYHFDTPTWLGRGLLYRRDPV